MFARLTFFVFIMLRLHSTIAIRCMADGPNGPIVATTEGSCVLQLEGIDKPGSRSFSKTDGSAYDNLFAPDALSTIHSVCTHEQINIDKLYYPNGQVHYAFICLCRTDMCNEHTQLSKFLEAQKSASAQPASTIEDGKP
ncbi:hypothetical protein QR680_000782 [Steinernema hermaphroditum]|uniref:ZP domain-containing protein n=1 Tax=Steinernema hermaphroditum TaxID=289476 RepID=A0AA39GWK7_9BILA|nr:hypothetical protein QR680_000782 [Steinernema hermaphroditum]